MPNTQHSPSSLPASAPCRERAADRDAELVAALLAGDAAAWRRLVAEQSAPLVRAIRSVVGRFERVLGSDAAEEILAAFWLDLLGRDGHKLRVFDPARGVGLGGWLRMLVVRAAYDHLRRSRRRPESAVEVSEAELAGSGPSPEREVASREELAQVAALCERLSARDQQFLDLFYGEQLEADELAQRLGIQAKTVYTKQHKIRLRLSAGLAEAA